MLSIFERPWIRAVRDAFVLCRDMGWSDVDIEGDATEVRRVVSSRLFPAREGGSLIADICHLLDSQPFTRLLTVRRQ
ncbi:hypothetical protein LINPERPRIM_LOCUS9519, partial [Linum perenne]